MKKRCLIILSLSLNVAADPFFGSQQLTQEAGAEFAKNSEKTTACNHSNAQFSVNFAAEFEKLKLVGLLKIDNGFRALFIDEKEQLIEVKENQFINRYIEIKNMSLKSLDYVDWSLTQDCDNPHRITLKL